MAGKEGRSKGSRRRRSKGGKVEGGKEERRRRKKESEHRLTSKRTVQHLQQVCFQWQPHP